MAAIKSFIFALLCTDQRAWAEVASSQRRLNLIADLMQNLDTVKSDIDSTLFLYQTPAFQWVPSTVYRYDDFRESLSIMSTDGVAGKKFYIGEDINHGHVYGLVNIAAFLAQSMKETIQYDACDENSWDLVNGKYPLSNACGQLGQSYQDYHCSEEEKHMECPVDPNMSITGVTHAKWYGAPGPLFCGPKTVEQPFSGFWDHTYECNKAWANPPETCDVYEVQKAGRYDQTISVANTAGRTDVEGCCWWGRGVIQTSGVCNFGKLNYFLGAGAAKDGRTSRYPNIDFCKDPEIICSSSEYKELKWIAGMFYWIESVQGYNVDSWDYLTELRAFVEGGMVDSSFIDAVSGIVNRGCHNPPCGTGPLDGGLERADNFKKVLLALFGGSISELPVSGSIGSSNGSSSSSNSGNSNHESDSNGGSSNGSGTAYYPDYNPSWSLGKCINDTPPPPGRPNFETLEECCSKSYGGQASGVCVGTSSQGSNTSPAETTIPPSSTTTTSTESDSNGVSSGPENTNSESPVNNDGGASYQPSNTVYWPDYNPIWSLGKCTNDGPPPSGRPHYDSLEECCNNSYGGQVSGMCFSSIIDPSDSQPDQQSPALWYPDYNPLWSQGKCSNVTPFVNGRPTYDTQLECCENAYRGQASGVCLADIAKLPTSAGPVSNTVVSLDMWYGNYDPIWSLGKCSNELPVPNNRPWYYNQAECCNKAYGGQASGACMKGIVNETVPIEAEGSAAGGFASYLQSQRSNNFIVYSCADSNIPSSSKAIDVMYDYEFLVSHTTRADLVLAGLKHGMMEHIADTLDCSNAVPRKLRRTKESGMVFGIQSSSLSDEIDTKTARCRQSFDENLVCVPVVGHLVVFVEQNALESEILDTKKHILKLLAEGQFASESIIDVVFIGEHIDELTLIQTQQDSKKSSSQSWIPAVVSLLSITIAVMLAIYYVVKRRRSVKVQGQSEKEHDFNCIQKDTIDHTTRMSECSLPTSVGDHEDQDEDQDPSFESKLPSKNNMNAIGITYKIPLEEQSLNGDTTNSSIDELNDHVRDNTP